MNKDYSEKKIEFAIYRRDPDSRENIKDVNAGLLFNALVEQPYHLANVGEDGTIKFEVQRTHEWEIVIALVLTGSGIFLKGALTEIGKCVGKWISNCASELNTSRNPEIRTSNVASVLVNPSDLEKASKGIAKLLSHAADEGIRVQVVLEPEP